MRVLLTGGNGFVGSHILDRLVSEQIPTVLLLRRGCDTAFIAERLPTNQARVGQTFLSAGSGDFPVARTPAGLESPPNRQAGKPALPGTSPVSSAPGLFEVEVRYGQLDDRASLRAALEGVTHVIHGAGATKGLRRADLLRVNQTGTRNLIQAVNETAGQVQCVLYVSSLAAGRPGTRASPAREDDPPAPLSAYGQGKRAGELEVTERCRCSFVILRPAGVYGPRDREFLRLFKAAALGITPLFGGGRQELSLVYAPDLAEAVVRALTRPAADGPILNVAGEEVVTAAELARAIAVALGKRTVGLRLPSTVLHLVCLAAAAWATLTRQPTLLAHGKRRELTAPGWVGDTSRLQKALGPVCQTRLEAGLAATLRWYQDQGWLG
jgi:nucleoside-diphosphate-sugar epimerase